MRGKHASFALGRLPRGTMNKTEAAYAEHLDALKHHGEIEWFEFEPMKFRLADNTFYSPDFGVMRRGGEFQLHEVKGHWMDDARVKIKVAAAKFPFAFIAIKAKSKREGGGWAEEAF